MTTAHRPTFHPSVAQANNGNYRYYAPRTSVQVKALPGSMKLNLRQGREHQEEASREQLKAMLELREAEHFDKVQSDLRRQGAIPYSAQAELPRVAYHAKSLQQQQEQQQLTHQDGERLKQEDTAEGSAETEAEELPVDVEQKLDEVDWDQFDDSDDSSSSEGEASDSEESDDSDDEEAELRKELERIKKEREEARRRQEEEQEARRQEELNNAVLQGNPLLNTGATSAAAESFSVKRRWDDDVVFRNQSRNVNKVQKRFINDTIRSDFHRRFLDRYIK